MKSLIGNSRELRGASFALVSAAAGVILMRIFVYFLPIDTSTYGYSLLRDALFSLPTQLLFFAAVPFLIYKYYGKRTALEVLEYSNIGSFGKDKKGEKPFRAYYLLAIPLGLCVFVVTVGVSSSWMQLLRLTGYKYVSSSPDMPEKFNFGFMFAEIVMTAILPAVCEEFCMRGGVLTSSRKVFKTVGAIVFCGVAFGLFHQNVRQVFYTALFGALAAYMTIRLRSIFPAMLMHFANNFASVFISYATNYGWAVGGGFYAMFDTMPVWAMFLLFIAVVGVGVGIVIVMLYFKDKRVMEKKIETVKDSAFDVTNKRVVLFGEYDPQKISDLEMEKEVYGADYEEDKYKPTARDMMIAIACGVTTFLTTVFTYVWGFFY